VAYSAGSGTPTDLDLAFARHWPAGETEPGRPNLKQVAEQATTQKARNLKKCHGTETQAK
jgi:hypothetical protein